MHTGSSGFCRGDAGGAFYRGWVPTRCFAERYRKDGAITVNHIKAKDERNFQTRFRHGDSLEFVGFLGSTHVQS